MLNGGGARMLDTELRLISWRDGSTQAERLAAAALKLSGFEEIDPQSPLGGPDGAKDIVCSKGGLIWIGAVYFPVAPVRFPAIKKKFSADLAGLRANHRGIVFVTNQSLTPGQRKTLVDIAAKSRKEADIVHLERLRALLDSPSGYGTRLQFLKIPMSQEEQLSWFAESDSQVAVALNANTREILALKAMIQRMDVGQKALLRTMEIVTNTNVATPDLLSTASFTRTDRYEGATASMSPALILLFHRLTCFDLPARGVGKFRTSDVWLGTSDGAPAEHIQPPDAQKVPELLSDLCTKWRAGFTALSSASAEERLTTLANFHAKFLVIHPFFDGNGRVARALLMQQCLDLFERADMSLMDKGARYYAALASADRGDPKPLASIFKPIVRG